MSVKNVKAVKFLHDSFGQSFITFMIDVLFGFLQIPSIIEKNLTSLKLALHKFYFSKKQELKQP